MIGGQVMLDENGICPPEYQHFLDFDEETGAPIWVNNCTCEVILEPIGGDGNFDVTKVNEPGKIHNAAFLGPLFRRAFRNSIRPSNVR